MYGRFADAEFCGGFPNGVLALGDIFSKLDCAFPCVSFQKDSSFSLDVGLCIWKKRNFILAGVIEKQLTLYDEKYIMEMAYFYHEYCNMNKKVNKSYV